jgi:hypothetical protein
LRQPIKRKFDMGLIRSLLVKLGMDTAQFDEGTRRASKSLYDMTRSMQASSGATAAATSSMAANANLLMRGGIYGALAKGAFEGFAEMIKSARAGEDAVTGLGKGIYGMITALPVVGRVAEAFKKLTDEITGARESREALARAGVFKKATGEMSEDIRRRQADFDTINKEGLDRNKIQNQYIDDITRLNKAQKEYESTMTRRLKLQYDIDNLEKMSEGERKKYNEVAPNIDRYNRDIKKAKDELQGLGPELKYQEIAKGYVTLRDEAIKRLEEESEYAEQILKIDEEIAEHKTRGKKLTEMQIEAEKQLAEQKKVNERKDKLILKRQEAQQKHAEDIKNFSERYDTDKMKLEKEYQELLRRRGEIGEAAFGRGVRSIGERYVNLQYAVQKTQMPGVLVAGETLGGLAMRSRYGGGEFDLLVEKKAETKLFSDAVDKFVAGVANMYGLN